MHYKLIGRILAISMILLSIVVNCQTVSNAIEKSLGGVVTVAVYQTAPVKTALGFRGQTISEQAYEKVLDMTGSMGSGSGFVIKKDNKAYIITNAHVIEDASDEAGSIYVFTVNQNKYEVKLVGGDSFYDIAVLEFVDVPGSEISYLEIRNSETHIGEQVFAIGNPLGEYPYTVTDGIISAKNRVRDGQTGKFGFLQTTATIIWGNSGGPLVDVNGEVVGINSQIAFADAPNGDKILQSQINFALESKIASRLIKDIINDNGRVKRAFIGIELSQKYRYVRTGRDSYRMERIDDMPILSGVLPGTNAHQKLATKIGYQITAVNNTQVRNIEEALGEFEKVKAGSIIRLTIESGGKAQEILINTGTLKTKELEMIGKYVLGQNKDITINYKDNYASFTFVGDSYYRKSEKGFRQYNTGNEISNYYYILAAGLYSEDYQNMWMVETFSDLGAAFKLSGLSGTIDFYVLQQNGKADDLQLMRQYLSNNEDIVKSTLWY